jgi:hypothetical protein
VHNCLICVFIRWLAPLAAFLLPMVTTCLIFWSVSLNIRPFLLSCFSSDYFVTKIPHTSDGNIFPLCMSFYPSLLLSISFLWFFMEQQMLLILLKFSYYFWYVMSLVLGNAFLKQSWEGSVKCFSGDLTVLSSF